MNVPGSPPPRPGAGEKAGEQQGRSAIPGFGAPSRRGSYLLPRPRAEKSLGSEDEQENQDREDEGAGPFLVDVLAPERADQADDDAAEDGAGEIPDPAEHRRGERVQPVLVPHPVRHGVDMKPV